MKHIVISLGIFSLCSTGYAAVDLVCEAILEPSADYVLADSVIVPKLKITNLGDQGASNFWVKLIVVEVYYTDTIHRDTIYAESIKIGYIGANPATIEVEMLEWMPEGRCDDIEPNGDGPFVNYQLTGIALLDGDEDISNDTLIDSVTSLLKHDVGVIEIAMDPWYEFPPAGAAITITATVENFGYNTEYDIPVNLTILDKTVDPDTLVYFNTQYISDLDWRGNTQDTPYTVEVTFPVWNVSSEHWFTRTCISKLNPDLCPDDDFTVQNVPPGIEDQKDITHLSFLQVAELNLKGECSVSFYNLLSSWLRLDVYDASGRFVRNLYNDPCSAGRHTLTWDGRDSGGKRVSSGAYFVRMETGGESITSKLVNIR